MPTTHFVTFTLTKVSAFGWIRGVINFHIVCFLVVSEATTKSKLASLNEKLDTLERRLELLEVQVGTATANPSLFAT